MPNPPSAPTTTAGGEPHLTVLDGWRGISILLVLATHLLPLGPREWQLNVSAGILGMAFFFVLSGFLVTRLLLRAPTPGRFLLRRLFRIVPLAWAYLLLLWLWAPAIEGDPLPAAWLARLLFYANDTLSAQTPLTAHLWSLSVEVQFYLGIALLVALGRRPALLLLPLLCLGVTGWRIADGMHVSILTQYRVDEILAGASLALIHEHPAAAALKQRLARCQAWPALLLLALACHPAAGWLNYLRPYLAAYVVGATLLNPATRLGPLLCSRLLGYVASISYALYVIHPALAATWLGSGSSWEKYAKRPLLFAVLAALAHLASRYLEQPCTALGKRLAQSGRATVPTSPPNPPAHPLPAAHRGGTARITPQENET